MLSAVTRAGDKMVNKPDMIPHSHTDGKSGNWFKCFGKLSAMSTETEHMHTL